MQKQKQKNTNLRKLFEHIWISWFDLLNNHFCFLGAILSLISLKDIFLWFFWNRIFFLNKKMVVAYRIHCDFKKCFCLAGGDCSHWTNFCVHQYESLLNSNVSTVLFYWLESVRWTSDGFEIVIEVFLVPDLSVYKFVSAVHKQIHYIEVVRSTNL